MSFKFLHTADWQLGLRVNFIPGDSGALVRRSRYESVKEAARVAKEHRVDAVLVCGDIIDQSPAPLDVLELAADALQAFAPTPVFLIAGNHDHLGPNCPLVPLAQRFEHVHLLDTPTPVEIHGAKLFPCSLKQRHVIGADPTQWVPDRGTDSTIRIVLAHGGATEFQPDVEDASMASPNLIDVPELLRKGVDYVALGDWHGCKSLQKRAWYSGAIEATRFKERDPGSVLLVSIDAPGADPVVERIPVANTQWTTLPVTLTQASDVDALSATLDAIPARLHTCLQLTLDGTLPMAAHTRLAQLIPAWESRFLYVEIHNQVRMEATEDELRSLAGTPFLSQTVEALRNTTDPAGPAALKLLHRLVQEMEEPPRRPS